MRRKVTGSGGSGARTKGATPQPALPAWKAFVVQFSRETEAGAAVFAGRVEHLSSGRRARFSSAEELIAVLRALLAGVTAPQE
jgi:hypothetical protein